MFASFLATVAVIAFLFAMIRRYQDGSGTITDAVRMPKLYSYLSAAFAGVVIANGLFHFVHGILGYGEFPAPFAKVFGRGFASDISNICWGLFNFIVAIVLIMRCRNSASKFTLVLFFIVGLIGMSFLLRFVLLIGYFRTHPF